MTIVEDADTTRIGGFSRQLRWSVRDPHGVDPAQRPTTAVRSLAFLFASGATLALVSLLLPHSPEMDEEGILVTLAIAYVFAAALRLASSWNLARWVLPAAVACGTALISTSIHFSDPDKGAFAFFYIWVALYSSYFLTRAQAALEVLYVAVAYAAVLLAQDASASNQERWLITLGTVIVAVLLIWRLKAHVEQLIARLADAARTDPLTGLMNRRGFQELVEVELERARRSETPLTIICADLDHFKRVNDRLGHQAGDEALVRVARALDRSKRRIDAAVRMGGEEFALLLPDTDGHGAYILAERVRAEVQKAFAGDQFPLTVSLGIATYPADAPTSDGLLRVADDALYAAKLLGRDRSVIYSPELAATLAEQARRDERQPEANVATVLALAEALDVRDMGTARHSETVGRNAADIAAALGLPAEAVERVRLGGRVHDIGKIGVADAILQKPGPLDDQEWTEMRTHPETGARILAGKGLDDIAGWVLAHHERPDGLGYPYGLRDEQIPIEAKILAVADAFEAMTSDRAYRRAVGREEALAELRRGAGTQFDASVVRALAGAHAHATAGA